MSSASNYSSFLESYDKGNTFLQSAAQSFVDQANIDKLSILSSADENLKASFLPIDSVLTNKTMDSYEKMNLTGTLLTSIFPQIIASKDSAAKNSGKNMVNNFFNVAKKTEDQQMLNIANDIAKTFS